VSYDYGNKPAPVAPVTRSWRELHASIPARKQAISELNDIAARKRTAARRTGTIAAQAEAERDRHQAELDAVEREIARLEEDWNFSGFVR
jgi:hypothetical protein